MKKIETLRRFNYREDFKLIVRFPEGGRLPARFPDYDITLTFYIDGFRQSNRYTASVIGGVCTACRKTEREELMVIFNHHNLGVGRLLCDVRAKLPDSRSDDGKQDVPFSFDTGVDLVDGVGDLPTPAEVEAMMPYALIDAYDMAAASGFAGSREDYVAGLNALPALVAMATDVTAGKAAVADALTRAGAPTAPDAPLTEMAEAVGSLPVSRETPDTLIPDLPALVAANSRADWPYVAAILTYSDTITLDGADAYMASGLPFTTEQGGEYAFPADGRLHYVLFYFRSEVYAVPYNSVGGKVRTVYCSGGHPAYGVTGAPGLILEADEAEGANASPDAQNISGGSWYAIASSMTAYSGGTLASSCANLTSLMLPALAEMNGGTLASSCANLTSLTLPALSEMNGGYCCLTCDKLTTLTLPSLRESSGGTLLAKCNKVESLELPELVILKGSIQRDCEKLTYISMPKLQKIEVESTGDQYIFANVKNGSELTLDVPELLTAESPDGNTGILGGSGKGILTVNAPKCVRWHTQISWGSLGGEERLYLNFGTAIDHIYLRARTWTAIYLNIGEGAICDIQVYNSTYNVLANAPMLASTLGDNTGNKTRLLQLNPDNLKRLSDEEKAILVAKNYSLS